MSNFNWGPALFILGYHLVLLVAVPLYFFHYVPSWQIICASAVLLYITGISVTAGYHRLYSHTTYKIDPVVEGVLLFFATMATQGSALRWSYEHRIHHAFVDTDRDPYSIRKGFWYAHFLWILEKPKQIEQKVVADLMRNRLIHFQHRFYPVLMLITNGLATFFVGWFFNDYLGAFLFAWLVRLFFLHHLTWFINSLAHTWGARTYSQELSAVDNYIIALLTWGEGYHNFHHTFANDYRNGVRWYHFDPTKWLIWTLNKFGLAKNLRKHQHYFLEEKLFLERKGLLLDKIQYFLNEHKETWTGHITKLSESVVAKLRQAEQLRSLYLKLRDKKDEKKEYLQKVRSEIKTIEKEIKKDSRHWMALSRRMTKLASSPMQAQAAQTISSNKV